jgi:UDP-2,3-diacylglucosamine hydrolase
MSASKRRFAALLISDLHLAPSRMEVVDRFLRFLAGPARESDQLLILGDLFEVWIGDDEDSDWLETIYLAMRECVAADVSIAVMRGNRDLLLGDRFAAACNATLLDDTALVTLAGTPTLLSHGDQWCTSDHTYQQLRRRLHSTEWQEEFLSRPLAARRAMAHSMRQQSVDYQQQNQSAAIAIDLELAVGQAESFGARHIVHGHLHRAGHQIDKKSGIECHSLAAWDESGHAIGIDQKGGFMAPAPIAWARQSIPAQSDLSPEHKAE